MWWFVNLTIHFPSDFLQDIQYIATFSFLTTFHGVHYIMAAEVFLSSGSLELFLTLLAVLTAQEPGGLELVELG